MSSSRSRCAENQFPVSSFSFLLPAFSRIAHYGSRIPAPIERWYVERRLSTRHRYFFHDRARRKRCDEPHAVGNIVWLDHPRSVFGGRRLRALVEQRRVDVAWTDRARANTMAPFFRVDLLRQSFQPKLGRHVSRPGELARDFS